MSDRKNKNRLTTSEQKTTVAFKLQSQRIKILEKSLKNTQDELEKYREKYHKADKNHAVAIGKNKTLALHEILKFIISITCGGLGVNFITNQKYLEGISLIILAIIIYTIIVLFNRTIYDQKS